MSGKLQKELKQTKPFRALEEEVTLNVARTAEHLAAGIAEVLKVAELTPTQYNALRILRGAGAEGLSCSEISERMVTKDSYVTRLLHRLDSRVLISRERPATNRRLVLARITQEGLRVLAELDEPVTENHRRQISHLGKERLRMLNELLVAVRNKPE